MPRLTRQSIGCLKLFGILTLPLVIAAATLLFLLTRDEAPPDLSDFTELPEVKAEDNGYVLLNLTEETVFWPPDEEDTLACARIVLGDPDLDEYSEEFERFEFDELPVQFRYDSQKFHPQRAAIVLRENQDTLARLQDALAAKEFQVPSSDAEERSLYLAEPLTAIIGCEMRLAAERDQTSQAYESAMRSVALGQKLLDAGGDSSCWIYGRRAEALGWQQVRWLLGRAPAEASTRKRLLQLANDTESSLAKAFERSVRSDAVQTLRQLEDPEQGLGLGRVPLWWRVLYLPQQTKRLFSEAMRVAIADLARPREEWQSKPQKFELRLTDFETWKNRSGKQLIKYLISPPKDLLSSLRSVLVERRAARLLLAFRSYFDAENELPESLNELVGRHIDSLPLDPFSSKPFRYSKVKGHFWSVKAASKRSGILSPDVSGRNRIFEIPFGVDRSADRER